MDGEALKRIIVRWAEAEPLITKAYIYGSRAGDKFREDSDLDVAIEIDKLSSDENVLATWMFEGRGLKERLSRLIPYKLHLELLDGEGTPTIWDGVEKSGKLVYSKKQSDS